MLLRKNDMLIQTLLFVFLATRSVTLEISHPICEQGVHRHLWTVGNANGLASNITPLLPTIYIIIKL